MRNVCYEIGGKMRLMFKKPFSSLTISDHLSNLNLPPGSSLHVISSTVLLSHLEDFRQVPLKNKGNTRHLGAPVTKDTTFHLKQYFSFWKNTFTILCIPFQTKQAQNTRKPRKPPQKKPLPPPIQFLGSERCFRKEPLNFHRKKLEFFKQ